jgi:hypothetical protein
MDGRGRPSLHRNGSSFLFLVGGLDLLDQGVDFFGLEFVGVLGHVSLAVVDDFGEVVGRGGGDFFGDESRASEVAAFGGFAVAFGALFFEDGIGSKGGVCGRRLGREGSGREEGGSGEQGR